MIERIGKYRLLDRIGRGGMGSVYKAYDPILDRQVALKVISAESEVTDELRARFFVEAQACARLTHPNIVTIYDLGEADGHLFIVMELLAGDELRQLIARRAFHDVQEKVALIVQLCGGLEYAHQKGIVHRDIKPANIFVLPDRQLKILDFGIARIDATAAPMTQPGLLIGTLQYMAPERVRQRGDHRSDIFSVGAVLYELLTDRPPFTGDDPMEILERLRSQDARPPSEVDATIPVELDAIVACALQKDPVRRFESLDRMRAALHAVERQLADTAALVRHELRVRAREVRKLREALAARTGGEWPDPPTLVVYELADESTPLRTLQAMNRDAGSRIDELRALLGRAQDVEADVQRGLQALARHDWAAAVALLARVVDEMPAHARAAAALAEAHRQRDADSEQEERRHEPLHPLRAEAGAACEPAQVNTPPPQCLPVAGALGTPGTANPDSAPAVAATDAGRTAGNGAWSNRDAARTWVGTAGRLRALLPRTPRARRGALAALSLVLVTAIVVALGWEATRHARARESERQSARMRDLLSTAWVARERAVVAEAPTLARTAFAAAEAEASAAARAAAEGNVAAAEQASRAAAAGYASAEHQAGIKRGERAAADAARDATQRAKREAGQRGADLRAAREHERQADEMYGRLAFKDAAARFGVAAEAYAAASPAESPAVDPRADIRTALDRYAKAIETKDLVLLRRLRPTLGDEEVRRWARSFEITQSRKVDLRLLDISLNTDEATATGRRQDVAVLHDGQRVSTETRFVYTLRRAPEGWVLHHLRETQDSTPDASGGGRR